MDMINRCAISIPEKTHTLEDVVAVGSQPSQFLALIILNIPWSGVVKLPESERHVLLSPAYIGIYWNSTAASWSSRLAINNSYVNNISKRTYLS
jgi:hypothetical protein